MTEAAAGNRHLVIEWVDVLRDGDRFECHRDLAAWRGGDRPRVRLHIEAAAPGAVTWTVLGSSGLGSPLMATLASGQAATEEQAKICAGTALETWLVAVQAALWSQPD